MKRRFLRFAAAAAACGLLSACAATDHFDGRVEQFDVNSEQSRDTVILMNIVRASRVEPLAFVQLGQVTGSTTNTTQLGLPSVVLGPNAPANTAANYLRKQWVFGANPGAAGFASNSTSLVTSANFNVTPEESQDFYRGLLLTVQPETLANFTEQGVAQETLMYLFTEKIVMEAPGGKVDVYVNDPFDPSFPTFQHFVQLAVKYGLSAEPQPGTKTDAATANSDKKGDKKDKSGDNQNLGPDWRLCFDNSVLLKNKVKRMDNTPMCGSKVKSHNPRMVSFTLNGVLVKLNVFPRSTFSIFEYLGRMVAAGDEHVIKLATPDGIGNGPLADDDLFVVEHGKPGEGCFVSTMYAGQFYCVPDSAYNTKRILGLLVQLIALNTSIRDIGNTPTVQLIQ
jgi:hypothetical protein